MKLAGRQRCEWAEGQPETETSPGVGRRVLSGRLCPVGGLWKGLHDSSKSDLAGGNQDKEAGTPHPPLLELSSAPANAPALGSPGQQHPRSSLGDPLLLSLRTPSLLQLSATLPKLTQPSRQEPKPASPNARGFLRKLFFQRDTHLQVILQGHGKIGVSPGAQTLKWREAAFCCE